MTNAAVLWAGSVNNGSVSWSRGEDRSESESGGRTMDRSWSVSGSWSWSRGEDRDEGWEWNWSKSGSWNAHRSQSKSRSRNYSWSSSACSSSGGNRGF